MKKKTLLYVLSTILLLCLMGAYMSLKYIPEESVLCLNGEPLIPLTRQSAKAVVSNARMNPYMYFRFTGNERARLENTALSNSGASVKIHLKVEEERKPGENGSFAYGFLYENDFKDDRHIKSSITVPDLLTGDFEENDRAVDLSLCITEEDVRNGNVPYGFVIYSTRNYSVEAIAFTSPVLGWIKAEGAKLYAFGSRGGKTTDIATGFDFSEGSVFFNENGSDAAILISFNHAEDVGKYTNQTRVNFNYGEEQFGIRRSLSFDSMVLPCSAFNKSYGTLVFTDNGETVNTLLLSKKASKKDITSDEVLDPVSVDLGMVLSYPRKNWRCPDYGLYQWQEFPHVLFFDFASYAVQNTFFTRLAYFTEKEGYKGTLISDEDVETKHGYNAHDYKADSLAAFFTYAFRTDFTLNDNEYRLCRILCRNGIIRQNDDGTFSAGEGAVISISRESPDYLRAQLMAHESWHGIYFTDEDFRNAVSAVYYMFDPVAMDFIKTFWHTQPGLGYDLNDEYLMQNEFMAYLMQQSLMNIKTYYINMSNRGSVILNEPRLADYVRSTEAQDFHDAASVLNDYAFEHWGFAAGRVNLFIRY